MIFFLKNWIEQIAIAVVITGIFEMIIPKGNIKKYIKVILGLYIIFCMISPFVEAKDLFYIRDVQMNELYLQKNEININQKSMDKRLQELYIDEIKNNIKYKIEEYGYKVEKIKVDADLEKTSKNAGIHEINITIKKVNEGYVEEVEKIEIGINSKKENEKENLQVEKLKEELAKFYEIDMEVIKIKVK